MNNTMLEKLKLIKASDYILGIIIVLFLISILTNKKSTNDKKRTIIFIIVIISLLIYIYYINKIDIEENQTRKFINNLNTFVSIILIISSIYIIYKEFKNN